MAQIFALAAGPGAVIAGRDGRAAAVEMHADGGVEPGGIVHLQAHAPHHAGALRHPRHCQGQRRHRSGGGGIGDQIAHRIGAGVGRAGQAGAGDDGPAAHFTDMGFAGPAGARVIDDLGIAAVAHVLEALGNAVEDGLKDVAHGLSFRVELVSGARNSARSRRRRAASPGSVVSAPPMRALSKARN